MRIVEASRLEFGPQDILVLPELIGAESPRAQYDGFASKLARSLGCYIVAGSHYDTRTKRRVNGGAVADPAGGIVARYEKLWPDAIELKRGVVPGSSTGHFEVAGCRVVVLICADFWYSTVIQSRLDPRPDVILVPAFSVSFRDSPLAARSLWRSMAISRAYEFGVCVGISDWAHPCDYHGLKSSSVAGFADPRPQNHNGFFSALGRRSLLGHPLDLTRLRWLRQHRSTRAFLSDESQTRKFAQSTLRSER